MKGFKFTVSKTTHKRIHGVLDWNKNFAIDKEYDLIRARKEGSNKVVGQLIVEFMKDTDLAWIFFFAVDPAYRGHGLGTELLHKAENFIQSKGYHNIALRAQLEFEDRLIPYYESQGYKITIEPKKDDEEYVLTKKCS